MPPYIYFVLAVSWVVWFMPFVLNRWDFGPTAQTDKRARWGMLLEGVAYAILWQTHFWARSPGVAGQAVGIALLVISCVLSWSATRALGRHLRLDAALGADHELVRSGPYRFVRHPVYASMFCLLLGTGLLIAPVLLLLIAMAVFIAGTEIRVRIEDQLLGSRFGQEFQQYRRSVAAYIPLIR